MAVTYDGHPGGFKMRSFRQKELAGLESFLLPPRKTAVKDPVFALMLVFSAAKFGFMMGGSDGAEALETDAVEGAVSVSAVGESISGMCVGVHAPITGRPVLNTTPAVPQLTAGVRINKLQFPGGG